MSSSLRGLVWVEPLVYQPTYHQKSKCHTVSLEIVFARAKPFQRNDVVAVTRPGYIPLLEFIVDAKINITSNDQIQSFSLKHKQIDARARCSRVAGWIRWNWSGSSSSSPFRVCHLDLVTLVYSRLGTQSFYLLTTTNNAGFGPIQQVWI